MINTIKNMLGIGPKVDYQTLMARGAVIMDVRTASEYAQGHIQGSINIPLNTLPAGAKKLKDKDKAIITCCASGMRSASAKRILLSAGYTEVYNGGGWYSLNNQLLS